jgi:hypothetical protein
MDPSPSVGSTLIVFCSFSLKINTYINISEEDVFDHGANYSLTVLQLVVNYLQTDISQEFNNKDYFQLLMDSGSSLTFKGWIISCAA